MKRKQDFETYVRDEIKNIRQTNNLHTAFFVLISVLIAVFIGYSIARYTMVNSFTTTLMEIEQNTIEKKAKIQKDNIRYRKE